VDLVGLVERTPPYLAEFSSFLRFRLGDPSDPETRERLSERSPINFAASIHLPTLIGHGALDGGQQFGLARQAAERAHDAGAPATFVALSEDGGTLARSPVDRQAYFAALEAFLAECLGGRLEPIEADVRAGHLTAPIGVEHIPALAAALEQP
jgi:dipeptidyl aminopeptidase/acylaminoacyl peptidase